MTARRPLPIPHHALPAATAFAVAAALALAPLAPAQQRLPEDRAKGAATVTVDQCKQWLGTLAGPEFEGRGTGQPGFEKAANYVAAHFQALGLQPRGENGTFFQHVPWGAVKIDAANSWVAFTKGGAEVLRVPAERMSGRAGTALAAAGDCVLLAVDVPKPEPRGEGRRGFVVPELKGLDDVDVANKVVLAYLRHHDDRPNPGATFALTSKLQGKNAAALLILTAEPTSGGLQGGQGARGGNRAATGAQRIPGQLTIGGEDVSALLRAAGIERDALATLPTVSVLPLRAQLQVELAKGQTAAPAMNVFAVLPGSDPKLAGEYVVIGSHLDHLGKRGDTIYFGADDDGSGTTGVLAVAQMFAKNPVKPARSVLFVCFSGEENGLVGSGHFADNCPIPLASIVAELQMDMIGRDEEENAEGDKGERAEDNRNTVHLVGTQKLAPSLHELCLQKNETAKLDVEYDHEGMFDRSDHANFARKGVPVAFFFTGLHRDYHRPTDTPDKIHYEKLLRIATWVYDIGFELATQPERPRIHPELWAKFRADSRNRVPETPAAPMQAGNAPAKADTGATGGSGDGRNGR
jgi:hypothetical protein